MHAQSFKQHMLWVSPTIGEVSFVSRGKDRRFGIFSKGFDDYFSLLSPSSARGEISRKNLDSQERTEREFHSLLDGFLLMGVFTAEPLFIYESMLSFEV